ncbi:MAG: hypothetical protein JWQ38_1923 [Flavipsychrobacter sp.]|nr:hypothetical protein [Flavipsychrobacter sp.]
MNITTNRVEAFSDCVISIVITVMVFDIKLPEGVHLTNKMELKQLWLLLPQFISYLFSFVVLGIMWLNHHHLLHLIQKVDEKFLWLNLHLLFWLSLIPFPTNMLGLNPTLSYSTATYGAILFMAAFALTLLRGYAIRNSLMYIKREKTLNKTIDKVNRRARIKNFIGMGAYLLSIPMSFWSIYGAYACFCVMPLLFFIPDGIDDELLAEKIIASNEANPPTHTPGI